MRTCEPGNVGIIPPDIAYMFKRSCCPVLVSAVATLIGSDSRDFIDRISLKFASRPGMVVAASAATIRYSASIQLKGLILAQNERWRRGLGMQVEREFLN